MYMANNSRYVVLVTFHGAQNLPIANIHNLSCNPFLEASIIIPSRSRPEDGPLVWRTPTHPRTRDPVWNSRWIVSGVPQQGFRLDMYVKDEGSKARGGRLGKAEVIVTEGIMREGFEIREVSVKLQKRRGSIIPWAQTYAATVLPGQHLHKHNRVHISLKVLGKAADQRENRIYTVGPNAFTQHFSPLLGLVVHGRNNFTKTLPKLPTGNDKKPVSASTLVATKLQLTGPTPKQLRCQYVGKTRFSVWAFRRAGISGRLLYKGVHKQYRAIYSYDSTTRYGILGAPDADDLELNSITGELRGTESMRPTSPRQLSNTRMQEDYSQATEAVFASAFLELIKYGAGGHLYTYVITLDAEWRFTETGDEFAIDLLSKHMMHANAAQVVMYAGEFFVQHIGNLDAYEAEEFAGGEDVSHHPKDYELVIDNNSGTYKPDKSTLPELQRWLADKEHLGGLGRISVMDAFDERLQKMKRGREELKKRLAGGEIPKKAIIHRDSSSRRIKVGDRKLRSSEMEKIGAEMQDSRGKESPKKWIARLTTRSSNQGS